jgi:hypothetical protein
MISYSKDVTTDFNANSGVNLDVSDWLSVVIQFVSPSGAVTFNGTNDSGAVQGVTDGNASLATNWVAIQATNMNTGVAATSAAASGLWKIINPPHFIQLTGTSVTATKVIVSRATQS